VYWDDEVLNQMALNRMHTSVMSHWNCHCVSTGKQQVYWPKYCRTTT